MNAVHWVVLAIVAFGASILVGSSIALGISVALLVALAFAVVTSRPVKTALAATRQTDGSLVEIGSAVSSRIQVRAGGAFALRWLLVHDTLPPGVAADAPTGRLVVGSTGLQAEFFYKATFSRRGVYQLGPIQASHGDILSLRTSRETLQEADEVVVHPRIQLMQAFQVSSARPLGDRRADRRAHEDPTRPAGSRPYMQGDPFKRIHWAASARTGTLVSKVYDASSAPIYVVVLNRNREDYSNPERFEVACTAAASVIAALSREGDDVGLLTQSYLKPDSGRLHLERCLADIARANLVEEPLFETILRGKIELPWRASIVLITEQLDERAGAALEMMRVSGFTIAAMVIGDAVETQRSIGRVAALGGSVARIEKEEDLGTARFVGAGR